MHTVLIKAYFIRDELLTLSRCTEDFNGTPLAVYDWERTICDCFKYRSKLDGELFSKAVIAYSRDKRISTSKLSKNQSGFWADSTRLPEFYDATYNYFKSLGIYEI